MSDDQIGALLDTDVAFLAEHGWQPAVVFIEHNREASKTTAIEKIVSRRRVGIPAELVQRADGWWDIAGSGLSTPPGSNDPA